MDRVKALIAEQAVEYLLCSFVELSGAPKAKLVPASHFEEMASEGACFAGFAAGHLGQQPHEPDVVSIPDLSSFTILPWRKNVAWVAGNLFVGGKSWPYCPRTILSRQLARARSLGFQFMVGTEPEFMLLKKGADGQYAPWDELDCTQKPCYDLRALNRNLDIVTTIVGYMQQLGWGPYATDHEDANCQFEINWKYSEALETCDRQTFFKWMVRTVAEQHGLWATFMPKPFTHLTGNGSHFHLSLSDERTGENLFLEEKNEFGLSQLARHFLGGLLHHARGMAAVLAPTVNSYKRLVRGAPRSGATWAPVYITYGAANRTQMVRIPGPGRIENRIADGVANPYLACAVMLAAGLDGIEKKIDPGEANHENLYEVPEAELHKRKIGLLPASLREAVDALAGDDVVREALGHEYADYFQRVKSEEWRDYHLSVSQWEIDTYLKVY